LIVWLELAINTAIRTLLDLFSNFINLVYKIENTIFNAALPTLFIVNALKAYGNIAPIISPKNVIG